LAVTNDWKSGEWFTAITALSAVITLGIVVTGSLMRLIDSLGPQTGDIIAFPATRSPSVSTESFAVRRAGGTSCLLDLQTIQKSGGSLLVESTRSEPDRTFQVHWAGMQTSSDRDDCGDSADLLLNSYQISALVSAAGGTGVKTQN
jgi:hypothetical protein